MTAALIEDTPVRLYPKVNNHGVGYDPFETRRNFAVAEARRGIANADPRGMGTTRRTVAAFGVGVFEGEDPDEGVYRTKTLVGTRSGTYGVCPRRRKTRTTAMGS